KRRARMTRLALERRVLAEQRKRDQLVIEADLRRPCALFVAAIAARAELPAVRIVGMAARALASERRVDILRVTGLAREGAVLADERKFRDRRVIEARVAPGA